MNVRYLISVLFVFFSISISFSEEEIELNQMFYFEKDESFPFYWDNGSIFSTVFEVDSLENHEISYFYESMIISQAYKSGSFIESASKQYTDPELIMDNIRKSSIILFIFNDIFLDEKPNREKINKFFESVGIDVRIQNKGDINFIKEKCGSVIVQDEEGRITLSAIYVEEKIEMREKFICIEYFSRSMFGVRPLMPEGMSREQGDNSISDMLINSIGYCRIVNREEFSCIEEYIQNFSLKIENLLR